MTTPIVVNDLVKVRVCCQETNQISLNSLTYKITALTGAPTYEDLAGHLAANLSGAYAPFISNTSKFYGISMQRYFPTAMQPVIAIRNDVGTGGATTAPRNAAAIITKKSSVPGKQGRGRIYVPFIATANLSVDGSISPAGLVLMDAIITAGLATVTALVVNFAGDTVSFDPTLVSATGIFRSALVGAYSKSLVGTQKRRGDFGRPNNLPF